MAPSEALQLTLADVARVPHPGRNSLSRRTTKFTPDGKLIYLHSKEGSIQRQLAVLDLTAICKGKAAEPLLMSLPDLRQQDETLADQLRRERLRDLGEGVSTFCLARLGGQVLTQQGSRLWVAACAGAELRLVLDCQLGTPSEVRLSNDGRRVAFVVSSEIYTMLLDDSSTLQRLTFPSEDSPADATRGVADFVAQEEFERLDGYWWSPDSCMIAFQEVVEEAVPPFRIQHHGSPVFQEEEHRYPFAGLANPEWRLGIAKVPEGTTCYLQVPGGWRIGSLGAQGRSHRAYEYLAGVTWLPDSSGLLVTLLTRDQKDLCIHMFNVGGQHCGQLHHESSATWINLNRMFWPFEAMSISCMERRKSRLFTVHHKEGFVLGSERSGFCHLYFHHSDGSVSHAITSGPFVVVSLEGITFDAKEPTVYFTATLDNNPTQQHLFSAPLFGDCRGGPGPKRRITQAPGVHAVLVNISRGYFLDIFSSTEVPEIVTLSCLATGKQIAKLSPELSERELQRIRLLKAPKISTFTNRDGTLLYMATFHPDQQQFGPGPYPTIVSMYGGPNVQLVQNSWALTASMREQFYCQRGFLVIKVDNRGSSNRGVEFESSIHLNMGEVEVRDQVDGLKWMVKQGLVQANKVVAMGWSYGGYMAARMLMHPDSRGRFAAAVAGAPVTHWDGYDTGYTERYMGTPESNPEGYESSSLFKHVGAMQGSLLLVHGLLDENVHFRHTARLINHLIAARKRYQLLVFPDERHMPRHEKDRIYMEESVMDFISEKIGMPFSCT